MAVGEYQTSTSVESAAGTPSVGENWENPVSSAASPQTASSSLPSMTGSCLQPGNADQELARPTIVRGGGIGDAGVKEQEQCEKHGLLNGTTGPGRGFRRKIDALLPCAPEP